MRNPFLLSLLVLMVPLSAMAAGLSVNLTDSPGAVRIVLGNTIADIYADSQDARVVNIAAGLLSDDVQRVTGKKPRVVNDPAQLGAHAVIVGSIGHSKLIDQLIAAGKIDVSDVKDQWETYKLLVVANPLPNVQSALVIVGSDRRGTAYGVFTLSEAIGVSPWYWWADVTPIHQDALVVAPASLKQGPPSVKYRGIFINDEDWGLQPWAATTFDPEFKDIGPRTYEKVFELLLRLKANYIWPAMHNCTIEFGKVEGNIKLADEWGIVAGASHPEGMNRNNVDWPTLNKGEWRFDTNRDNMVAYWEEWAKKRGPYEAVWTIGMRGVHDAPMLGPSDMPGKVKLLEQALGAQRELLAKYVNPSIEKVAQIFCPYKEALQQYRAGLKVPDDVTICWTEDNFGYIRQLSNPQEQQRKGGSGVYYHISYLGSPFSYVWINTTPPALIWEEMIKAYDYGADRVWMLNVGDIKPGEIGMQFWTTLAWDINSYKRDTLPQYLNDWAAGIFGKQAAPQIAAIMDTYYRLGFARKPESLHRDPACFSVENYDEATNRLADYQALLASAEAIAGQLSPQRKDAYYELVLYPVRMAAATNEVFICSTFARFYAQQGNPLANSYAPRAEQAMAKVDSETAYYNNELAGGKWKNMMTPHGTTSGTYGFRWPQLSRTDNPSQTPAIPAVRRSAPPAVVRNPSFIEKDGYVSLEAEHFTRSTAQSGAQWQVIPGLGRSGDSVSVYPVTVASIEQPDQIKARGPVMEYDLTTSSNGEATIWTYCLPTRRINDARGLRYAIAIDNEPPQIVDFNQLNEDRNWQQNVMRNASIDSTKHMISAGKHTLKVWMVDPGVVMDKIVIDFGGAKPSYLGPPETLAMENP